MSRASLRLEQLIVAWQSVSLLLDYPDEALLERVDLLRSASRTLPVAIGDSLRGFLDHLEATRCRSSRRTTSRPSTPGAAATSS